MVRLVLVREILGTAVSYRNPPDDYFSAAGMLLIVVGGVLQFIGAERVIKDVSGRGVRELLATFRSGVVGSWEFLLARAGRPPKKSVRIEGQTATAVAAGLPPDVRIGRPSDRSDAQRLADLEEDLGATVGRLSSVEQRADAIRDELSRLKEEYPAEARRVADQAIRDEQLVHLQIRQLGAGLLLAGIGLTTCGSFLVLLVSW